MLVVGADLSISDFNVPAVGSGMDRAFRPRFPAGMGGSKPIALLVSVAGMGVSKGTVFVLSREKVSLGPSDLNPPPEGDVGMLKKYGSDTLQLGEHGLYRLRAYQFISADNRRRSRIQTIVEVHKQRHDIPGAKVKHTGLPMARRMLPIC